MNFETVQGPMIPRFKRSKHSMKLGIKAEPILKAEYASQAKLDGDSRAFCSDSLPFGPLDRLANCGIVPMRAKVKLV